MTIVPELKKLKIFFLNVRGEEDQYLISDISNRLVKEILNSRLVKIPSGWHFIQEGEQVRLSQTFHSFIQCDIHGN